jgi:hypothetical protein
MLNIIKSKLNIVNKQKKQQKHINVTIGYKYFVPVVRDWKDSIYAYNKNTIKLIPVASNYVIKLIKGYFNSFNLKLENKLRKERLRNKSRKLSTNKIFLSNGEFKHTNDKVSITLYVYNRQKYNYLYKLKIRYIRLFSKIRFLKRLNLIKSVGSNILNKQNEKKNILDKILPRYKTRVSLVQHLYYKKFLKKSLKRLKYYMFYKQLVYINQNKFTLSYLQGLIYLLKKIYNKNIEFNLINLKYFYFNSDILSQPLVLKLRRKRKVLYYLKSFVRKVNIDRVKIGLKSNNYFFDLRKIYKIKNVDILNNLLYKLLQQNKKNSSYKFCKSSFLKKVVFSYIKYKRVSGVRLEAAGRLTKRYTASRSLHKVMYKGNLENTLSSVNGYSSVVLRGNFRPNLGYTKLNSKARIGSFGIKGWVSGE